jgi:putative ABC transport system substrate-binding protein
VGKQVELLKEVVPSLVRMAVLWNPTHQAHATMLSQGEAAARALGLQPQRFQARGADDYEPAFSAITRNRAQALLVLGDVTVWRYRRQVAELAAKSRLPTMFVQREHAEAGGLMSYGASLPDNYRRAAAYVDKILKGTKPADLAVEQPTKFELVINLKTANALGLSIPPSLLLRADQVIE